MRNSADVIVVGAGLVGVAVARALARDGRRVLAFDRGEPCAEATRAAAGMLAPQIEAHGGNKLLPLAIAARDRYPALAAECAENGHDIGLSNGGIAHVALSDERAEELRKQAAVQRSMGFDAEWLTSADLRRRHPGINPAARGALLAPKDGCVNNVALAKALLADAQRLGVVFAPAEVVEISTSHGRVTGVRTELDAASAPVVVIAAGAWSGALVGLPRGAPVEPVRGQMAATRWPSGEPPAVIFGDGGYIVARGDEALLGSTMEHVGFALGTTDEGLSHVRAAGAALLPALAGAPLTRSWSGLRPMSPDGLPILGPEPKVSGLIFATGHGRNGILLAPLTGDIVRDLVVRGETHWDLSPYSIARFWG